MNRIEEIEARLKAIQTELELDTADIPALDTESKSLIEEKRSLIEKEETRQNTLKAIADNTTEVRTMAKFEQSKPEDKHEELYRSAFLKNLLDMQLTEDEQRAFVHTTENVAALVPEQMLNKIYSNMEEKHPILRDVQILRTGAVITVAKHTSIDAGDAKVVAEGEANDDEENVFVNVTLAGKDFSKHVDFSYRMGLMAIPAFENFIVREISDRIGAAMARDIIAQIKTDLHADNQDSAPIDRTAVLAALGALKQTGRVNVYTNNATFYSEIATLPGDEGMVSFIPNWEEGISGQLLGKAIKEEDALDDGEILFLDPDQFLYNVVQDIMIERDRNIKTHVHTYAGFAIAEGALLNDKAGYLLTVTEAAG